MANHYRRELNLMNNFFEEGIAAYRVHEILRRGYQTESMPRIDARTLDSAVRQVNSRRHVLDMSTPLFSKDINYHFFGGVIKPSVVLVVEGVLHGQNDIQTVIGVDISDRYHLLFKEPELGQSIDDYITWEEASRILASEKARLMESGYTKFTVTASKFFYFNREHLVRDFTDENGSLDIPKLLPIVTRNWGYILDSKVSYPSIDYFMSNAPTFTSSRLKTSLAEKLNAKLTKDKTIPDDKIICDWAAHRIVVSDEQTARSLANLLRLVGETPDNRKRLAEAFGIVERDIPKTLGKSRLEYITYYNYYDMPNKRGYEGINMIFRARTSDGNESVREVQVVGLSEYYNNEINQKSRARHGELEKQRRPTKKQRKFREANEPILKKLYGRETMEIELKFL